jgi:hypothetical protein
VSGGNPECPDSGPRQGLRAAQVEACPLGIELLHRMFGGLRMARVAAAWRGRRPQTLQKEQKIFVLFASGQSGLRGDWIRRAVEAAPGSEAAAPEFGGLSRGGLARSAGGRKLRRHLPGDGLTEASFPGFAAAFPQSIRPPSLLSLRPGSGWSCACSWSLISGLRRLV